MFFDLESSVNIVAIVIAVVVSMGIGFAWYSMSIFGKPWMKMSGLTNDDLEKAKKTMGPKYALMIVGALVMACVLAIIERLIGVTTVGEGIQTGFFVWLGFVATVGMNSFIFENKPFKLYLINEGYQLVSLLAMGGILAFWAGY